MTSVLLLCHVYPRAPCIFFFWSRQVLELNVFVLHWWVVILKIDAGVVGFWVCFFFSLKGQTFLYVVSLAQGKVLLWNSLIVSAINLDRSLGITEDWMSGDLQLCFVPSLPVQREAVVTHQFPNINWCKPC